MRSLLRSSALAVGLLLLLVAAVFAGTPQTFTVQGVLRDGAGNVVANGPYALILSGWSDSTGGSLLWIENKNVTTSGGLFQVTLDGAAPVSLLSKSGLQYVQVQVSGQAPMVPRIAIGSVPSALLSTRMDGDVVTRPNQISVGSGDPDFDLLRITAGSSSSNIGMGGDPDFDLLRLSATPSSSNIHMGGDPDFDLLRLRADSGTGSITMGGDPDFDLLRIKADSAKATISMGGDPDFDLLRITTTPSGSSMVVHGDPDFDLLRMTAVDSTATLSLTGDPDFDLLRLTTNPQGSSIHMGGDPDFDLLRMSAVSTTASLSLTGDPDFDLLRITANDTAASIRMSGDPDFDLLRITAGSTVGSIAIGDPGVNGMTLSNDVDGDGVPGPIGIAVNEEGTHNISITADSGGGSIAIDEEGVQVVRLSSGGGGSGGGGGGGSIAVNEDGTHNIVMSADSGGGSFTMGTGNTFMCKLDDGVDYARLSLNGLPPGTPVGGLITLQADSTGGSIAIDEEGVQAASIRVQQNGRRTFNLFDTFPCGIGNMELSTESMIFRCTPGGALPDTTVYLDKDGNMRLDGSLAVGGNICASGTIGACSDARYKTDVATLTGALAQISRLHGVNFTWRQDEFPDKHFRSGRDLGFIAQELKEVVPQVVTQGQDGYYSVDYGRLTPILVEAVKELEARLAAVEQARQAELASLTDRLAALELQMATLAAGNSPAAQAGILATAK